MRHLSSHTPVFNPRKIIRRIGLRETTPGGVSLAYCGIDGGVDAPPGSDSLHGGVDTPPGSDVINANVTC